MPLTFLRHASQKPHVGPLTLVVGHPLAQQLVCAVPMNEYGSAVVSDQTGQALIFTQTGDVGTGGAVSIGGAPTWSTGPLGPQITFDGATKALDLGPAYPARITSGPLSIVASVKNSGAAGTRAIVAWAGGGGGGYEFRFANAQFLELLRQSTASLLVDTTAVPTGALTQVGVTYDGATVRFYVGGSPTRSAAASGAFAYGFGNKLRIGGQDGIEWWDTDIAAVYIWNRILSAADIASLNSEPFAIFQTRPLQRWILLFGDQHARPSADVTDGNWLNEAASNVDLYASIDEVTIDDTTYIQSGANPQGDLVEVSLGAISDPLVTTGHVLRYRTRLDTVVAGSGAMSLVTELRQGAAALSAPVSDTIAPASVTETTNAVALSDAQADAITDYSTLRLRSTATQAAVVTPSLVGVGTALFTATNNATFTPTIVNGSIGDLLILVIQRNDTTAAPVIANYTNIADLTGTNSTTQSVAVYYKYATSATGSTDQQAITFGTSTVVRGGVIFRISSSHPSAPEHLGTKNNVASTATTVAATNLTSTIAHTLGVFIACNIGARSTTNATTNWPAGTGVTAFASQQTTLGNDLTIGYAFRTFDAAGSYLTPGITWTTNTTTGVGMGLLLAVAPVANASKARITWAELEVPGRTALGELGGRPYGLHGQHQMHQLLSQ